MCETANQYSDQSIQMLVKRSGRMGRSPVDLRRRIESLLAIELRAKHICDTGSFSDRPCPFCGIRHGYKDFAPN